MEQDTKLCARCHQAPRNGSSKSYCVECQRALARESQRRRMERGREALTHCSRCGMERTGSHPCYCVACFRIHREERRAQACARCGAQRDPTDKTNPSYCYRCWRDWWLRRKYGITGAEFEALLATQEGRCAVCRAEPNGRTWHVDHDHDLGIVRGILCDLCNRGIGHFRESSELLQAAANYLRGARP